MYRRASPHIRTTWSEIVKRSTCWNNNTCMPHAAAVAVAAAAIKSPLQCNNEYNPLLWHKLHANKTEKQQKRKLLIMPKTHLKIGDFQIPCRFFKTAFIDFLFDLFPTRELS